MVVQRNMKRKERNLLTLIRLIFNTLLKKISIYQSSAFNNINHIGV